MTDTTSEAGLPVAPVALAVDDALPTAVVGPLTRTDLARYAGAGGDFHPLHHDETFARAAGFPSVFAMGLLHAGVLSMRLARWVGPDNVRRIAVRFTSQVWPGDTLTCSGRVIAVEQVAGVPLAQLELEVTRQTGDVVIRASAVAQVAERASDTCLRSRQTNEEI
jgi:acyl dehydratase